MYGDFNPGCGHFLPHLYLPMQEGNIWSAPPVVELLILCESVHTWRSPRPAESTLHTTLWSQRTKEYRMTGITLEYYSATIFVDADIILRVQASLML